MKRILSVLIILSMLSIPAFAEVPDLSSMTLEELIELRVQLNAEIDSRFVPDSTRLYNGTYFCGADLEPGVYLVYNDIADQNVKKPYVTVDYPEGSLRKQAFEYISYGDRVRIVLEQGCALTVVYATSIHIEKIQ